MVSEYFGGTQYARMIGGVIPEEIETNPVTQET